MASNYTEHYGLCQWEATDQVRREEFNEDNAKVDATLQELKSADVRLDEKLSSQAAAIQKLGNCELYTKTYMGTGSYGEDSPTQLIFPSKPWLLAIISKEDGSIMIAVNGQPTSWNRQTGAAWNNFTWSGNTVSWWSNLDSNQMNGLGVEYQVVALMQAE